ncbi:MAG: biopolymer transporter ExbD [Rhodothermaceae bacterium]|nr:biopolymer transporter ExbD [Rhodothermaceae bacterium]
MQWTYLPIPKSKSSRLDSTRSKDIAYLSYKRRTAIDEMHRVTFYVTRIIFLWVAIHVGESISFPLFNHGSYSEAIYAEGILVPQANAGKPLGDRRLFVTILVHKDNRIKINGELVGLEDIIEVLRRMRSEQPKLRVKLMVDQRCQMGIIHKVLALLHTIDLEEVYFTTSAQGGVYL